MKIAEVVNSKYKKDFLKVPKLLYKNDEFWVCPLDIEIESIFDPEKNNKFKGGEATRWVLYSANGDLTGRVAAFIEKDYASVNFQPTGGMGFFECIDDEKAAFLLFDVAKNWLNERGMEAMDAPINFGENHSYWGLLIDGFMHPGIGMQYHKTYYRNFFENYGFRNYYEQYAYHKDLTKVHVFPERFMKIATWISKNPGYSFRHFEFKKKETYIGDIVTIYNSTWSEFKDDFTPLDYDEMLKSLENAKPFIDEELIWFAYYKEKPVSFFIIFPDLNQILRHMNGEMHFFNKLRFLYYKYTHEMTRIRGVVAGVDPKFQNSGIESAIFKHLYHVFKKKPYYKELELSWIGDFNPKMQAIYEAVGAEKMKTYITYRYLFNPDAEFMRYKDEMGKMRR